MKKFVITVKKTDIFGIVFSEMDVLGLASIHTRYSKDKREKTGFVMEDSLSQLSLGREFFKIQRKIGKRDETTYICTGQKLGHFLVHPLKVVKFKHLFNYLN